MDIPLSLRGILTISEKNMRIYYSKPPVLMFGILFPIFMFLSFSVGRNIELSRFFPGFLAMMLFFTASSVGPMVIPFEKRERTYERLLAYPVTIESIILGDICSGAVFGIVFTIFAAVIGVVLLSMSVQSFVVLVIALVLGTFANAALGVLLASPSFDNPPNVMMMSNLIRFPLIFVSGIFVPLQEMDGVLRYIAYCSPLTYLTDLFQFAMNGISALHPAIDMIVLIVSSLFFFLLARTIQKRNLARGL